MPRQAVRVSTWTCAEARAAYVDWLKAEMHLALATAKNYSTLKARMGATHCLIKTLPRVSSEMALYVLAYNLTRVLNILGSRKLLAAIPT